MATTPPSEIQTWFRQRRLTRAQFGGVLSAIEDEPIEAEGLLVGSLRVSRAEAEDILQGLQFGGITSFVGDVAGKTLSGIGTVLEQPPFKQVGQALEFERQLIGVPIAKGLVFPFKPVLPESIERGIVTVGSALFTPSNAILFFAPIPGTRVAALARIAAGSGRAAVSARSAAVGAQTARLGLRETFSSTTRTAARAVVARRTGQPLEELLRGLLSNPRLVKEVDSVDAMLKNLKILSPRRWQTVNRRFSKRTLDFAEQDLLGLPPPRATPEQVASHAQNNAWFSNMVDDITDSTLPDNIGLLGRIWNSDKTSPFVRGLIEPLVAFTQPLAFAASPLRRAFIFSSNAGRGLAHEANATKGYLQSILTETFGAKAYAGEKFAQFLPKVKGAQAWREAHPEAIGRLADVVENRQFYKLTKYEDSILTRYQNVINSNLDSAIADGVAARHALGAYIPHRISIASMGTGEAARFESFLATTLAQPRYAAMFKGRRYNWGKFLDRAEEIGKLAEAQGFKLEGGGVEWSLERLLDWRLGLAARKRTEQGFLSILSKLPETEGIVGRRIYTFRGKTVAEEFLSELGEEALEEVIMETVPLTLAKRVAEVRASRELSLVPAKSTRLNPTQQSLSREADGMLRGAIRKEAGEGTVSRFVDFMRATLLSADISPIGMVQGMRVFSTDPRAWLAQMGEAATWMTTKRGKQVWALQNLPSIQHWTKNGLTLGNVLDIRPEMLRRLTIGAGKFKVAPLGPIGWLNTQLMDMVQVAKLQTANTMLSSMLLAQKSAVAADVLGSLPWYRRATNKLGSGWRDAPSGTVTRAIADGLNNTIGPVNVNLVNKEGVFSLLERMLILTPSFTRGNIGQIVNAAKFGTPKGVIARWLLMNQLMVGAFLSTKLSMTFTGEMPSFNPRDSDFLSVRMPWGRFNILPSMPVYRLPVRLLLGRDDAASVDQRWGEFLRFSETRMGQVPRIAIDLIQGHDFLGRRIDDKAAFLIKEMFPILGQEFLETRAEGGISPGELAQRLALEFTGTVVIPKTPFQLERERVEQLTGQAFDEVPKAKLRRLRKSDEQLRVLRERQRVYRADRGGPLNQFFNILADRTEELQTAIDEFIRVNPVDSEGFMAKFAAISSRELADRAIAAQEAKEALGIEEDDIQSAPTKILRDALAIEYWTIRPELDECTVSDDADACEDRVWREFRERREFILTKAPSDEIRRYIVEDFAATRYAGNPVAEEMERRRVRAQLDANEFFETSPYLLPTGQEMPRELLDAVFEVRREIETIMITLGADFRKAATEHGIEDATLPDGTRRRIIVAMMQQEADPLRQAAFGWQILWNTSRLRDFLRNPRRDDILLANTDMIKFRPDVFGRFIRASRILDQLRGDPEIVRIAAGQG